MNKMIQKPLALAIALCGSAAIQAEEVTDLKSMVTEGDVSLDFRYRYEHVDDDAFDRVARQGK